MDRVENIHYSPDLEKQILGAMMLETTAYGRTFKIIDADTFYKTAHKTVYQAISELWQNNEPTDSISVYLKLYRQGVKTLDNFNTAYFISTLTYSVVSTASLEYHCLLLRQMYVDREIIRITTTKATEEGFVAIGEIERELSKLRQKVVVDDFKTIDEILVTLYDHMDHVETKELSGVTTGFKNLDRLTGGLQKGCMYIIGARPSVGKSAFMGKMVLKAAMEKYHVGVISLEMTDNQIAARMASITSEIDYWRIYRSRMVDKDQRDMFYQKANELSKLPITISDTTKVNIGDIKAKVSRLKSKGKIDVLYIDYLQLLDSDEDVSYNRENEVRKISRGLKLLAKDYDIPIVVLAQLNRASEHGSDKKPKLHNLRESGSLEQDADGVIFIHRDWMSGIKENSDGGSTESEADIIIAKWRDGEVTEYKIAFDGPKMRFYEPEFESKFKPIEQLPF